MPIAYKPLPDQEYLRQTFDYDPAQGALTWAHKPRSRFATTHAWQFWNSAYAGKKAGNKRRDGRLVIVIEGKKYQAHRLIYKWMTGKEPNQVDHVNVDRTDNSFENLRDATESLNKRNSKVRSHSISKIKGVYKEKDRYLHKKPYRAQISINGRTKVIGRYATAEEAHDAYCQAAKQIAGEFFNPG